MATQDLKAAGEHLEADALARRMEAMEVRASCLAHRREVRWIPAPGWWIHADCQSCTGCWGAAAPIQMGWLPRLPGYRTWTYRAMLRGEAD